jgi:nicotinamidase/pyrazinamidase
VSEALLIIDVQNDFTPGGALGVPDGDAVIAHINELIASGRFARVFATRDWHPPDHGSFETADPPGPWPVHCVQGTPGAELHPDLDHDGIHAVIDKGRHPATEGYSAFDATGLADRLRAEGIDAVTIVGLATDYCVRASALDALREGFEVTVHARATRPVDVTPGDGERALKEIRAAGGRVT